jgi:hypothetical protein
MAAQMSGMRKELEEMKLCHATQHFNILLHDAACASAHGASLGTSFYNLKT